MGSIDDALKGNEKYSENFSGDNLPRRPAKKLAVVTCMDARMSLQDILGLKSGDINVIRNAGGIVSKDVIRSLIISHRLLGIEEIMIINHTDCGLLTFKDEEFREELVESTGTDVEAPKVFYAFSDLEDNVREQISKVEKHPWIPRSVVVRGFVYDVKTGRLSEVTRGG